MKQNKLPLHSEKGFLKTFFTVGISTALVFIIFNSFVDPFGIIGAPLIQGFNKVKPRALFNARMVKAHQIKRIKPHGLILGSSRAETGIDPEHPGWFKDSYPVYNVALPSARIFEIFSYLRYAEAQNHLAQVVLGLDFFSFDSDRPSEPGFEVERLETNSILIPNFQMTKDILTSVLSFEATKASLDTLKKQDKAVHGYLDNGSQDTKRRREMVRAKGGHFAAFESVLRSTMLAEDGITKLDYGHDTGQKAKALKWFSEIVSFCIEKNIELYIFISPIHSQWLEMMWQLNAWGDYEQWKRDIVRIVEFKKQESKDKTVIELWDFSGYNNISMEKVPAPGNVSQEMNWYWEASHYKRKTGDLLLDRVLLGIQGRPIANFGVKLSLENIETHLKTIREERASFLDDNVKEVEFLKNLIFKTLKKKSG
ncbi:hypothetical protein [Desulfospira joergensenii]|uniref:hypothetical protein n=1 Tax=Desulfospira joergensenii TaxID=53329 RepID=UPI0012946C38|nr:hypothetical protein [Desulfospira joergensenii]